MLALDNPVCSALTADQASFGRARGLALRYRPDVSPLSGLLEPTPQALDDLRELTEPGERVGVLTTTPLTVGDGWNLVGERWIDQMVLDEPPATPTAEVEIVELGPADADQMQALTAATQPGPWAARTYELGRYIGIRDGDRLAAMAGERMKPVGAIEISAVCTDPEYAGRGYAKALMATLVDATFAAGRVPMLHVKTENGAKRLYERLGFRVRREMRLTVVTRAR